MNHDFVQTVIEGFTPIDLQKFNTTANFLDRIDKKFIVHRDLLPALLSEIQKEFYVLEIDGRTIFGYKSVYMDTKDYDFYSNHAKGSKKRVKIRNRQYTDSGTTFFEFKQKDKKLTRKFRYQVNPKLVDHIDKEGHRFIDGIFQSIYSKSVPKLSSAMTTQYKRITFAGKHSHEKLTIDMGLEFIDTRNKSKTIRYEHFAIIESKSTSKNRKAIDILEKFGLKPQKRLSKYCLGIAYHKKHKLIDRFKNTLDIIENLKK